MAKYQQGKIYKIVSDSTDKIYIGSTCEPTLSQRMARHRASYQQYLLGKYNYNTSFEFLQNYNDCQIILVENYPCQSKDELLACERYWIEQNKPICVNKYIPTRTKKEYYEDHKNTEEFQEKRKQYYTE